jgi:hypothetical protein
MLNIPIKLDDLLNVLDKLPEDQKQIIREHLDSMTAAGMGDSDAEYKRIPGLNAGMIWISDDFDDPLPDEFWLGET